MSPVSIKFPFLKTSNAFRIRGERRKKIIQHFKREISFLGNDEAPKLTKVPEHFFSKKRKKENEEGGRRGGGKGEKGWEGKRKGRKEGRMEEEEEENKLRSNFLKEEILRGGEPMPF